MRVVTVLIILIERKGKIIIELMYVYDLCDDCWIDNRNLKFFR
jgi:hypothetical protein